MNRGAWVVGVGVLAVLDPFIRRMSIMKDADWQGGDCYATGRYPTRGEA